MSAPGLVSRNIYSQAVSQLSVSASAVWMQRMQQHQQRQRRPRSTSGTATCSNHTRAHTPAVCRHVNELLQYTKTTSPNHTHTHTRLTALSPGLPRWAGTRKVKPIWILQKQETVSGSGICWTICKSAPRSRQITTPAPHHSVFLQAGCPSCRPTNSVKALKASPNHWVIYSMEWA